MVDRQEHRRQKRRQKPLNPAQLRDLALAYVARFATSSSKLERYLNRKIYERGWEDEANPPDIPALVARYVELGYIDDEAFARAKSRSLTNKGYGKNRVRQVLGQDGISELIREEVMPGEGEQRQAALSLARKRRFGPYGEPDRDPKTREKQIAAMLRAGHNFDNVRFILDAASIKDAEEWAYELDGDDDFSNG